MHSKVLVLHSVLFVWSSLSGHCSASREGPHACSVISWGWPVRNHAWIPSVSWWLTEMACMHAYLQQAGFVLWILAPHRVVVHQGGMHTCMHAHHQPTELVCKQAPMHAYLQRTVSHTCMPVRLAVSRPMAHGLTAYGPALSDRLACMCACLGMQSMLELLLGEALPCRHACSRTIHQPPSGGGLVAFFSLTEPNQHLYRHHELQGGFSPALFWRGAFAFELFISHAGCIFLCLLLNGRVADTRVPNCSNSVRRALFCIIAGLCRHAKFADLRVPNCSIRVRRARFASLA